jgi:predicted TIM-barrel fold metal-dependent hydrolase
VRKALEADLNGVLKFLDQAHFAFVYAKPGPDQEFAAQIRKLTITFRREVRNKARMKYWRDHPEEFKEWESNFKKRIDELKQNRKEKKRGKRRRILK